MRICELVQIDTETVTNVIMVDDFDEDGELVGQHEEVVTKEVPVMGTVYRDATPEEVAQAERDAAEMAEWERTRPRTAEERVGDIEDALVEVAGIGADSEERIAMIEDALVELAAIVAGGE